MTTPAGSGELTITRDDNRIAIAGHVKTAQDRDQLRTSVEHVIATLKAGRPELVIDVGRAMYLDVAVLTLLIGVARRCVDCGMTLALEGVNAETLSALYITRIDEVLEKYGARITPGES